MMFKPDTLGTVIAARALLLDGERKVEVLLGAPQQLPDHEDWYCSYRKTGIGPGEIMCGYGVDAVQALVLTLAMIGAQLYCSDEYQAGRMTWDAGRKGELGFPVSSTISDVLPVYAEPAGSGPKKQE